MKAIGEAGLKIPEDISIIGFDNTILSSILIPDLTGVACDYEDFSKKLVETAIGAAERREMPKEQITDVSLIIRSSCRMIKLKIHIYRIHNLSLYKLWILLFS